MKITHIYLSLAVLGTVLPYSVFIPWLLEHGIAPGVFLEQMFANPIASAFSLDVIGSALALVVAVVIGARQGQKGTILTLTATFLVGISAGLPLYLYFREKR